MYRNTSKAKKEEEEEEKPTPGFPQHCQVSNGRQLPFSTLVCVCVCARARYVLGVQGPS